MILAEYARFFLLKFKSEEAQIFWKFKARVKNENGCKIQTLRSDNGKEYTSVDFNKFCEDVGIEHQLTTPYTPQQNGVVTEEIGTSWKCQDVYCMRRNYQRSFG